MSLTHTQRERLESLKARKNLAREQMSTARAAKADAKKLGDADMIAAAEQSYAEAHDELAMATGLENVLLRQLSGEAHQPFGQALRSNLDAQHALQDDPHRRAIAWNTCQCFISSQPRSSFSSSMKDSSSMPSNRARALTTSKKDMSSSLDAHVSRSPNSSPANLPPGRIASRMSLHRRGKT